MYYWREGIPDYDPEKSVKQEDLPAGPTYSFRQPDKEIILQALHIRPPPDSNRRDLNRQLHCLAHQSCALGDPEIPGIVDDENPFPFLFGIIQKYECNQSSVAAGCIEIYLEPEPERIILRDYINSISTRPEAEKFEFKYRLIEHIAAFENSGYFPIDGWRPLDTFFWNPLSRTLEIINPGMEHMNSRLMYKGFFSRALVNLLNIFLSIPDFYSSKAELRKNIYYYQHNLDLEEVHFPNLIQEDIEFLADIIHNQYSNYINSHFS